MEAAEMTEDKVNWVVSKVDEKIKALEEKYSIDLKATSAKKPIKIRKLLETEYERGDRTFPNFTILSRKKSKKRKKTPNSKQNPAKKKAKTTGGKKRKTQ